MNYTKIFTILCCIVFLNACNKIKNENADLELNKSDMLSTNKMDSSNISFACLNEPKISSATPGDTSITSQDGLNCFAWQTFIGLNWEVDPNNPGQPNNNTTPKEFGQVGTNQNVVWESYANLKDVMRKNAQPPEPWGVPSNSQNTCSDLMDQQSENNKNIRYMASSRTDRDFNLSEDTAQAFPSKNPNWLADKNGNIVYYEILMGEDSYNYITDNKLYDLDQQKQYLEQNKNIALPQGYDENNVSIQGGLELKAAWLKVTDPQNPKWLRFKTTQAYIYDEQTNGCMQSTMALVGLHIIRKTASQPQWVWATFEHIDNAPDTNKIKADGTVEGDYTFYNNSCSETNVPSGCQSKIVKGVAVTETSCQSNVSPAYYLDGTQNCPAYPIRISRVFPITDTNDNHVDSINQAAHQLIKQANADSVFQNYILVNVLWSSAAVNDNQPAGNPPIAPLSTSGETPSLTSTPVANTMLESYAQGFNCLSCHKNASISSRAGTSKKFATDYSFIFSFAHKGVSE